MVELQVEIINKLGLHARAAAKLVSIASTFCCEISVGKDDKVVDGKSIMSVMMLAASKGTLLTIRCHGEDQDQALEAITALIANYFEEGE